MTHSETLELIDKAKNGCSDSFQQLSCQYQDLFYKICHKYRIPLEKTGFSFEEVLEEKDNLLFKCVLSYDENKGSKFSTWLSNQSRYFCLNKMGRKVRGILDDEFDMTTLPVKVEEQYVESDCQKLIDELINSLEDDRAKSIFQIRYNTARKNLSWDKVAESLNISRVTARKIHNNALAQLREQLCERNLLTIS